MFLLDHPAYFLRGAPRERLKKFRDLLRLVKETLHTKGSSRFAFLKGLKIRTVCTKDEAIQAVKDVRSLQKKTGGRISIDEESDLIDGKRVTLCVGFCPRPGDVWVFVLDHPDNKASARDRKVVHAAIISFAQVTVREDHASR